MPSAADDAGVAEQKAQAARLARARTQHAVLRDLRGYYCLARYFPKQEHASGVEPGTFHLSDRNAYVQRYGSPSSGAARDEYSPRLRAKWGKDTVLVCKPHFLA